MDITRVPVDVEYDDEAHLYCAYVPDIPGCGEGDTADAAIEDLKEALRLFIELRGTDKAISLIRPRAQVRQFDLSEVARG